MNRLDDLEAFVAVVEAGSITHAADRLNVAKSAVSRRLAALEGRLGVELIRRTTRRLNLTDTGQGFYEQAARILADLNEAESAAAQSHGELRGRLKIALPLSFGLRHMAKPIGDFALLHPKVSFDLDLNDRRVDLLAEGADLALRIGRLDDSSLIARRLFEARSVVVASPDYLKRHGTPQSPEELTGHQCLVYSNLTHPNRWRCQDRDNSTIDIEVRTALASSSGDLICSLAADGHGIAMQPSFIAGDAVSRGDLVPLLTDYEWPVNPAWALYPPTRHLSYRVRAFIDFLADTFSGTPVWDRDCGSDC